MEFELTLKTFLIVCPLVFLGGFVDSIGGGGGIITIPAYLMAGLPAHLASGTNKFGACFGTITAALRYVKTGNVDYGLAFPGIGCSLFGAWAGARLALILNDNIFKIVMIVMVPLIAAVVLKNKTLEPKDKTPLRHGSEMAIVATASLIIGMYDGFYGPGTGTFLILVYTKLAKKDVLTAESNSKLCNLASNVSSLAVFLIKRETVIPLGIAAAVCSVAGNYIGSGLTIKNGSRFVRVIILCVIGLLAVKVLIAGEI